MAIAFVQSSAAVHGATDPTLPAASTAGNLIVVTCNQGVTGAPASATLAGSSSSVSGETAYVYIIPNCAGGLTQFGFTVGANANAVISEWSGVGTSVSKDTDGGQTGGTSPLTATTTGNVSTASELGIISFAESDTKASTTTMSVTPVAWTNQANNGSTSLSNHFLFAYQINPTSGSTLSGTVSTSNMNITAGGMAFYIIVLIGTFPPPVVSADIFTEPLVPQSYTPQWL